MPTLDQPSPVHVQLNFLVLIVTLRHIQVLRAKTMASVVHLVAVLFVIVHQIISHTEYDCICHDGYSGDNCNIGLCDFSSCLNGGVKVQNGTSCSCYCSTGYSDVSCEITLCSPAELCQNGKMCSIVE